MDSARFQIRLQATVISLKTSEVWRVDFVDTLSEPYLTLRMLCVNILLGTKGARRSRVAVLATGSHLRKVRTPQSTMLGNAQAG